MCQQSPPLECPGVMSCCKIWEDATHLNAVQLKFMQVLLQDSIQRLPAALKGLTVFVDTLKLLVTAQHAVATAAVPPQQSSKAEGAEEATAMEEDPSSPTPGEAPMPDGSPNSAPAGMQGFVLR